MAEAVGLVASIIAVLDLSAKVLGYINAVKDASKDRARCGLEISNMHGLLEKLRFRAEQRNDSEAWYEAAKDLTKDGGLLDQFKQALDRLDHGLTEGGRLRRVAEALRWKFKKEEVLEIMTHLERLKSVMVVSLQMDQFELSKAIKDDTKHIPAMRSILEESEQKAFVNWISLSNHPAEYASILKDRQKGTAEWFVPSREVDVWLNKPKTTLLCHGNLGTGKSMISAVAIEHLLRTARNDTVGVAWIFIHHNTQNDDEVAELLAALLKQLIQVHPEIAASAALLYKKHAKEEKKLSVNEIFSALKSAVVALSTVYIIVDALDECVNDSKREQLVEHLQILQSQADVRLMITSRIITNSLRGAVKLEVKAKPQDIKRYVAGKIDQLPDCIQRDAMLQVRVQEKVADAVGDMFLLATLHVDKLRAQLTKKNVITTLNSLSHSSLNEAYQDVFKRIENQGPERAALAKRVLSWITLARRPMTAPELLCALAVELETQSLDVDNLLDIGQIQSICAGLIDVEEKRLIVGLRHNTAQTYLESIIDKWNPRARVEIAETCLTYLSFDTFRTGRCLSQEALQRRFRENDFFMYAAEHWSEHVRTVQEEVGELACSFLLHKGLYESAAQTTYIMQNLRWRRRILRKLDISFFKAMTALQYVAYEGLCGIMEGILKELGNDAADMLNAGVSTNKYGTPLAVAATRGNIVMVKLLIQHGAQDGAAVLHSEINRGQTSVVRALLDFGVSVNSVDSNSQPAFINAVLSGNAEVVRLLLDYGADVGFIEPGQPNGTALLAATLTGDAHIVRMLLEAGADIGIGTDFYDNPIVAAAEANNKEIMDILLGATNTATTGDRLYMLDAALCIAATWGHEQMVTMLLVAGANPNAKRLSSALQLAARNGHRNVASILVAAGADTQGRTLEELLTSSEEGSQDNDDHSDSDREYDSDTPSLISCSPTLTASDSDMEDLDLKGYTAMDDLRSWIKENEERNVDITGERGTGPEKERQRVVEMRLKQKHTTW